MNAPPSEELTIKAILLGNSNIGKTCIIRRLCENSYDETTTSLTLGACAQTKTICFSNTKRLKLAVWDTAGQECYRSLNKIFYRDAKIVILVYDITNRKTFEDLKYYWYRQVESSCEKNPIIGIAGNKCDLFNEEQVSEEEGIEFAMKVGATFKIVSALNGVGVNELFKELSAKVFNIKKEPEKKNSIILKEKQKKKKCCR